MAGVEKQIETDVLVIGGGNAGLCAALSARELGASVCVIDRGPRETSGGNTRFSGGGFKIPYENLGDIRPIIPDLSAEEAEKHFSSSYPKDQYLDDMGRVTNYRADPDLIEVIVNESYETVSWLTSLGVRFIPWPGWQGMPLQVSGGGAGLVERLTEAAERSGVEISYDGYAHELIREDGRIVGAIVDHGDREYEYRARSVVLASGGFQASAEWRARYLGPEWDLVPVRGTWANTGEGIRMALDIGAQSFGHWSKAHAAGWDLNAPPFGDPAVGDAFKKHCFDLGIIVNARGERFFDEGSDFRAFSYTKYAPAILQQPGAFAWQVFDAKVTPLLSEEYHIRRVTRARGNTIEELAKNMDGVDAAGFLRTVERYNAAVDESNPFNLKILDGRATAGLSPPKSNWAQTISDPPFEAYAITTGITFTYGGIKIDPGASVVAANGASIPGLFAAGEMVGGIFYYNYAAGASLTSGSVFGRIAGRNAVLHSVEMASRSG